MKRRFQIVAVALAFGFALSGCGNDSGQSNGSGSAGSAKSSTSGKERGMNMQEAAERSDAMLDAVLKEINPEVQWAHGPTTTGSCDVTRRRTVMTIVSAERRQNFLDQVEKFWRGNDYRIKAKNNDKEFPAVYAQTKAGFGISVSFRGKGQAFFEADSPCVKESKVADPASKPNGPAYEGVYPLPRPNVHSDYWSAGAS
ncbi:MULTISPECIES: hypothetical protein [unclassified Streptomyces]|uniref:hypothetical protein n=1 Tax=unclassified Streptomyces TaxID=2593676 RepID=UPI002250DF73|nr:MULTISPECIES: hypothetical protein [unclassified Streptomyces]WSP56472.1 hypothetical protein OG306_20485 [Streptomyces sp. NBC_01241]WSU22810.1 hypothetical protein OG508_18755 [Streptomyces sp. NBC_01108]MCX4788209.1 hypothetical protein [Streptomyces sp. NBC_01221]MCX4796032.1 hypothetical protein [Streptomyces sp. NBC_01242]WSJ37300.1 hypothetical protein OG772_15445 [Streptomyces sp. NBC_01321]